MCTSVEVARWEAKGGKRFISLLRMIDGNYPGYYHYEGENCSGNIGNRLAPNDDAAAIAAMMLPWGQFCGSAGPAFVLQSDFPSVKRVK